MASTQNLTTCPGMASFVAAWEATAKQVESAVDGARVAMMPFVSYDATRIFFNHEGATTELLVADAGVPGDEIDLKLAFEKAIR
jgi:hypothetical protein